MNKKSILHILKSTKRDLNIIKLYNSFENLDNTFLFDKDFAIVKNTEENFRYISELKNVHFYDDKTIPKLEKDEYDIILVYSLNINQIKICFKYITKNTILIWKSLGGEIYNNSFIKIDEIYQNETLHIVKQLESKKSRLNQFVRGCFRKFSLSSKFFRRVDFVSPMLENEMNIINRNKNFNAKYIHIPLGDNNSIKTRNVTDEKNNININNIYVGSSAAPTSNHMDVFKKISELKINVDIHVTLSYKVNKPYRKIILDAGYKLFGDKFKPQIDFTTKEEFGTMLNKCSIAIFNIDKQEGLYTIQICLKKGMKVFLSDKSPMYHHLKSHNYKVFSFQKEFKKDIIFSDNVEYLDKLICSNSVFLLDDKESVLKALDIIYK